MLMSSLPEKNFNLHTSLSGKKILLGKITTVHGLQGWVKIYSWTQPKTNIFGYNPWWLRSADQQLKQVTVEQTRSSGQKLLVRLKGCHDRDHARLYVNSDILIDEDMLPSLGEKEYYWHQLEGLNVFIEMDNKETINIGQIHHLLDTGANDVIIVRPTPQSIDERERWIPWLEDQVILNVDLSKGEVQIKWDPDF